MLIQYAIVPMCFFLTWLIQQGERLIQNCLTLDRNASGCEHMYTCSQESMTTARAAVRAPTSQHVYRRNATSRRSKLKRVKTEGRSGGHSTPRTVPPSKRKL